MPDRGKERDGTDGIMLPSNLLLCQEQTAVAHGQQWHTDTLGCGHTGTQPQPCCPTARDPCLSSCPGLWEPCRVLWWLISCAEASRT